MIEKKSDSLHDIIVRGVEEAAVKAQITHKNNNIPIVISRNGKIIEIPPEEIVIPATNENK